MELRNKWGELIFTLETAKSIAQLVTAALRAKKFLSGADLSGAVLRDAVLRGNELDGIPQIELGMAGIHRSSTLGRAEPAEKQQVGAVLLFKREESAQERPPERAVFSHKRPPFCRIAGL